MHSMPHSLKLLAYSLRPLSKLCACWLRLIHLSASHNKTNLHPVQRLINTVGKGYSKAVAKLIYTQPDVVDQ